MPEEWGYHRNGNDRFLPSTRNEEELNDLNEMGRNDFGPVPLDFSWLATNEETHELCSRWRNISSPGRTTTRTTRRP